MDKSGQRDQKRLDEREAKATDMELLIDKIMELPPGQLKKILSDDVMTILEKYGVVFDK
jgi:hypothetical protein